MARGTNTTTGEEILYSNSRLHVRFESLKQQVADALENRTDSDLMCLHAINHLANSNSPFVKVTSIREYLREVQCPLVLKYRGIDQAFGSPGLVLPALVKTGHVNQSTTGPERNYTYQLTPLGQLAVDHSPKDEIRLRLRRAKAKNQ